MASGASYVERLIGVRPSRVVVWSCVALSLYLFFFAPPNPELNPRLLAIGPLLFSIYVLAEYPGPGDGVGKQAAALGGLKYVEKADKHAKKPKAALAPPPLGEGGALLSGHAYLIVFFNTRRATLKAAVRADAIARRVRAAGASDWFHAVLISRDDVDELEAAAQHWPNRAVPIAQDATQAVSASYITAHRAWAQPHAFLVGRDGRIVWHGQINRKALTNECARMLRTAEAAAKAAGGGGKAMGKADGKSSKAKPVKAD